MDEVVSQILEKQVLSAVKAVKDKLDEEIATLDRLDLDDIEALSERRIQQMRRAAERHAKWRALGHGEYTEIPEKEVFSAQPRPASGSSDTSTVTTGPARYFGLLIWECFLFLPKHLADRSCKLSLLGTILSSG